MTTKQLIQIINGLFEDRIQWAIDSWDEDDKIHGKEMIEAFEFFKQCEIVEKQIDDTNNFKPNFTRKKRGWE